MPATERDEALPRVAAGAAGAAGVSMRDLLASCAAAKEISTPPRDPAPEAPRATPAPQEHRRAA
ncbi:hypothetical protein ABT173_06405 [Streptomyces sp. NPDC001795]|uniref:hypothetical protein n=1 Tax=unclassified Streptomyces TaxID=2593676 RepID=UPI0033220161